MSKTVRKWFRCCLLMYWIFKLGWREESRGGKYYMHDVPRFVLKSYTAATSNEAALDDLELSVRNKALYELKLRHKKRNLPGSYNG